MRGGFVNGNRRKPKAIDDLHGSARWAMLADVKKYGLIDVPEGKSVYLGEFVDERGRRHALRDGGNGHVAGIAPTRSGKGVAWVLNTLLGTWRESFIGNDEKGELIEICQPWLLSQGYNVLRWQPGSPDSCDATYNFLDAIRVGTDHEVSDAQDIAIALLDPDGKGFDGRDSHWKKTAFSLISGLCLFAKTISNDACLGDIASIVSDPGMEQEKIYALMAQSPNPFVAGSAALILGKPKDERGSVISTMQTALELFRNPIINRNTSHSSFSIESLVTRKSALFIVTPGLDRLKLLPLKRLMQSIIFRTIMSKPLEFDRGRPIAPYPFKILGMLDEFPSDGRQQVVVEALTKGAAWGIKLFILMQDLGQLADTYGQNNSILANCGIRLALAPNELKTAEWLSKSTGMQTIVHEMISESGSGSKKQTTRSMREQQRYLLTPDEVMRLEKTREDPEGGPNIPGEMLMLIEGGHAVRMLQTPYYLSPRFNERAGA